MRISDWSSDVCSSDLVLARSENPSSPCATADNSCFDPNEKVSVSGCLVTNLLTPPGALAPSSVPCAPLRTSTRSRMLGARSGVSSAPPATSVVAPHGRAEQSVEKGKRQESRIDHGG